MSEALPPAVDETAAITNSNRNPTRVDSVGTYLNEIGKTPLLNREQEVDLAQRIEAGVLAWEALLPDEEQRVRVKQLANDHYDSDESQVRAGLESLVSDGEDARKQLWVANLRLVASRAAVFHRARKPEHLQYLDLIQEGTFGLDRAIDKFDYRKGHKFSTYAQKWIDQFILRGLSGTGYTHGDRTIRVPTRVYSQVRSLGTEISNFIAEHGCEPSAEQLAAKTGLTVGEVQELQQANAAVPSLNLKVGQSQEAELGDLVRDTTFEPGAMVEAAQFTESIKEHLDTLKPRERNVIERLYGFTDGQPHSVMKIAKDLKLSKANVVTARSTAERKLRRLAEAAGLQDFLSA